MFFSSFGSGSSFKLIPHFLVQFLRFGSVLGLSFMVLGHTGSSPGSSFCTSARNTVMFI